MSEKSVSKRQYTDECKAEAIRLAETVGQHEAARRLGVGVTAAPKTLASRVLHLNHMREQF